MWAFSPALESTSTRFVLPRPVTTCKIVDRWETARFSVPLRDGDVLHGRSRTGVDISIRGRLGQLDGDLVVGEPAMFDVLESMREAVHDDDPDARFGLALFVDGSVQRGFKECRVLKLEYDLSDAAIFAYSLIVHASDPRLYEASSLL